MLHLSALVTYARRVYNIKASPFALQYCRSSAATNSRRYHINQRRWRGSASVTTYVATHHNIHNNRYPGVSGVAPVRVYFRERCVRPPYVQSESGICSGTGGNGGLDNRRLGLRWGAESSPPACYLDTDSSPELKTEHKTLGTLVVSCRAFGSKNSKIQNFSAPPIPVGEVSCANLVAAHARRFDAVGGRASRTPTWAYRSPLTGGIPSDRRKPVRVAFIFSQALPRPNKPALKSTRCLNPCRVCAVHLATSVPAARQSCRVGDSDATAPQLLHLRSV